MVHDARSHGDAMDAKMAVEKTFHRALVIQQPLAREQVARLRRVHSTDTPPGLIKRLDFYYLTSVTASGGAAGGAALVPGLGVPAALVDAAAFTEASILYVLCLAEVHQLHAEDVERRQLLALTVLMGDGASSFLKKVIDRTGGHWAAQIVNSIPMSAINKANAILGPRFITKYGTKQGVLVLSKQVPLGIGAGLGASGNHLLGRATVKAARKTFGPPPSTFSSGGASNARDEDGLTIAVDQP